MKKLSFMKMTLHYIFISFKFILRQQCPQNLYVENGRTCNNGKDYCVGGVCRSREMQCKEYLGEGQSM